METLYLDNIFNHACTFEILQEWSLTIVSGIDSAQYLQNQFTANIIGLSKNSHILCAHCHANGKVQGVLRIFHYQNGYAYIQRKSITQIQLNALKKYSVFSKVNIVHSVDCLLLGIMGSKAKEILSFYLNDNFNDTDQVHTINNITILSFNKPITRFLLIVNKNQFSEINRFFLTQKIPEVVNQWLISEIKSGLPIFEKNMFQRFFPQELNLDMLNSICLKKGCYSGQEIISKMHFKNINNKKLYCLIGTIYSMVDTSFRVENYNGIRWRKIGRIIFIFPIYKNIFLIQCILDQKKIIHNIFRITSIYHSKFFIFNKI